MSKHLLLLSLLCCGLTAQAAKVDYQIDTEFRLRAQYNHQPEGTKSPGSTDSFEHRLKLGGAAKINERFGFNGTLLHNAIWGSENQGFVGTTGNTRYDQHNGINNSDNMILVQEAYGRWILNESMSIRFGRSQIFFGDGLVMAKNDYLRTPSSFDGAVLNYEIDYARFMLWGARLARYNSNAATGASDPDPQANSVGLFVDAKKLPPFLKMANLHVIRNTKASTPGTGTTEDKVAFGENGYRYGLSLGGDVKAFDYRVSYAGISTNYYYQTAANGPVTKYDGNAWMLDLEGGFRLAVMDSRVYARYHTDSGDGSTSGAKAGTYNPYFYEQHGNGGEMDLLRWGNLTYYSLGFSMKPMDQLTVGIEGYMFRKTQQQDNAYAGFNGSLNWLPVSQAAWVKNSSNIGNEIDLYAEKVYDGGFSVLGRVSYFMAGDYLKDNARPEAITQVFLQGKMNF